MKRTRLTVLACATALPIGTTHADTFGTGANTFTIDFVTIGNPGNGDDAGAGGGIYSQPFGGVSYVYRMGVTEVPQDWIDKATNLGLANVTALPWTGNQPAGSMTWYEAAAFVNWLNASTGHQAAYNLNYNGGWSMNLWDSPRAWQLGGENRYRNKDAYYFLPSDDEWYKAAYHQNDGVTANYWDYATGSNTIPTAVMSGTGAGTAVYNHQNGFPAAVDNNGGLSAYGTRGQNGNVLEWQESAADGVNSGSFEDRATRGGDWTSFEIQLSLPWSRIGRAPSFDPTSMGFRVASVPEPGSALLFAASAFPLLLRRRR